MGTLCSHMHVFFFPFYCFKLVFVCIIFHIPHTCLMCAMVYCCNVFIVIKYLIKPKNKRKKTYWSRISHFYSQTWFYTTLIEGAVRGVDQTPNYRCVELSSDDILCRFKATWIGAENKVWGQEFKKIIFTKYHQSLQKRLGVAF